MGRAQALHRSRPMDTSLGGQWGLTEYLQTTAREISLASKLIGPRSPCQRYGDGPHPRGLALRGHCLGRLSMPTAGGAHTMTLIQAVHTLKLRTFDSWSCHQHCPYTQYPTLTPYPCSKGLPLRTISSSRSSEAQGAMMGGCLSSGRT